jgi:hypothetical protein
MVQDELHQEKNSPQRATTVLTPIAHIAWLTCVSQPAREHHALLSVIACQSRVTCVELRVKCLSGETSYLVAEVHRPSDRWTWLLVCITVTTR